MNTFRIIATLLLLSVSALAHAAERPPNIVFILADDVGREVLGCYGGESYDTPNIDALAASGMRFEHCYAMPVCHPTRIAILTGRYPSQVGNPGWGNFPKSAQKQTVAQVLQDAGYATAVSGKWQLTLLKKNPEHPHQLGFDGYSLFGWHEGPRYYQPLIWQNGSLREDTSDRYGPEVYCDFLIDFLAEHRDEPVFAFYSMALCHDVTDDLKQPVPFGPGKNEYDSYKEMAEAMDVQVGRLVDGIDRLGLRDQTLIVFTGDNGTARSSIARVKNGKLQRDAVVSELGDRKIRGGKGSFTDAGTRVPLIANWKGMVEPGSTSDILIDMTDFLPTFADLAGGAPPSDVTYPGKSFAFELRGEEGEGRHWVRAESRGKGWVRTHDYKRYDDGRLVDVRVDWKETPAGESAAANKARDLLEQAQKSINVKP